jgi:1-acyl-sn-glycerol-3-phosphate acyltransferase
MSSVRPPRLPLRATPGSRVHFAWAAVCAALVTIPLSIGMVLHSIVRRSARTFKLWVTIWGRVILFATGVRLRTDVRADLAEDQPMVFVANHQNMLDIITCAVGIPHSYGFAAKIQLRQMPFVGSVLAASTSVFVDRSTPRRAAESIREAAAVIRSGTSVLIFPEGERSYGPELLPFLRGAFLLAVEAGVPVVPVIHLDNYQVANERLRAARPGPVHMVVAEPISTTGYTRADIPALMERTRSVMQAELDRFHHASPEEKRAVGVSLAPSTAHPP